MQPLRSTAILFLLAILVTPPTSSAANETFSENFDGRQENASINGVDSWSVDLGKPAEAVTQSQTAVSGNALKLTGSQVAISASRSQNYGSQTPVWIDYKVRPGKGMESRAAPTSGIGAVTFDPSGQIMVANGKDWVAAGQSFDPDTWYRVLMKLDFSTHTYDIYVHPAGVAKTPFSPDKSGLAFIDPGISALSKLSFFGVYNKASPADSFVDQVVVNFVKKVAFISAAQKTVKNQTSGALTVQIQNENSEPQAAWEDVTLLLTSSSTQGEFSLGSEDWSAVSQVVIPEGASQATFYYKDARQGKSLLSVKESPDRGWEQASHEMTVMSAGEGFTVAATTPQTAGSFFPVKITAKNDDGQTDTLFSGTVEITTSYLFPASGTRFVSPEKSSGFVNGVLNLNLSYSDAGSIEIIVHDIDHPNQSGTSGAIVFLPASMTVSASSPQKVSQSFSFDITALGSDGSLTPNYQMPVKVDGVVLSPADTNGGVFSPAELAGTEFQGGAAHVSGMFNRWGTVQIKVTDSGFAGLSGISQAIQFRPTSVSLKVPMPASGRDYFFVGENFDVMIEALDGENKAISNFQGTVAIQCNPTLKDLPTEYTFRTSDGGRKIFSVHASDTGDYDLGIVATEDSLKAEVKGVKVRNATIQVISTEAAVGTTSVQILLLDEHGNRINDSNFQVTITLSEENSDDSADSTGLRKPIFFKNGFATIDVSNTESETVTITPQSEFGFKIQPGTVKFGKVMRGGVGATMMWEIKDSGKEDKDHDKEGKKKNEEDE